VKAVSRAGRASWLVCTFLLLAAGAANGVQVQGIVEYGQAEISPVEIYAVDSATGTYFDEATSSTGIPWFLDVPATQCILAAVASWQGELLVSVVAVENTPTAGRIVMKLQDTASGSPDLQEMLQLLSQCGIIDSLDPLSAEGKFQTAVDRLEDAAAIANESPEAGERSIVITRPREGETLAAGATYRYYWETENIAYGLSEMFTVEYSTDGGVHWEAFAGVSNDGSDPWSILGTLDSDQCILRMTSRSYPDVSAISATFSIHPASEPDRSITITAPRSGETLAGGETYRYSWETQNIAYGLSEMFTVEFSTDGGARWEAFAGVSNDGSDPWRVPNDVDSDRCMLRMTSRNHPEASDVSAMFSIHPAPEPERSITITRPRRGETLTAGTTYRYYWETENIDRGLSEMFTVEYSTDGGVHWEAFAGVSNDGSDPWSIPGDIDSDQCMLRMTSRNYPEVSDVSGVFSVHPGSEPEPERSITITRPQSGEALVAGSTYRYYWETENIDTGLSEMFTVEYSTDGGAHWEAFAGVSNDGSDPWDVPSDIDSDQCMLRMTSRNYPEVFDVSDVFSIHPE